MIPEHLVKRSQQLRSAVAVYSHQGGEKKKEKMLKIRLYEEKMRGKNENLAQERPKFELAKGSEA